MNSLTPNVIHRGNKVLSLSVDMLGLRFLDSMLFCPGSLASLAQRYQLEISKGHFPHMFNAPQNYNYSGGVPPFNVFTTEYENVHVKEEKRIYHAELEDTKYNWNFKKEIHTYCVMDTVILAKAMMKFLQEWFDIQKILQEFFPTVNNNILPEECPVLHPFSPPYITFSSKVKLIISYISVFYASLFYRFYICVLPSL